MQKHLFYQSQYDAVELLSRAIVYKARLNKSGKSYYVYLPRRYNNVLKDIHRKRQEVRVIVIPP